MNHQITIDITIKNPEDEREYIAEISGYFIPGLPATDLDPEESPEFDIEQVKIVESCDEECDETLIGKVVDWDMTAHMNEIMELVSSQLNEIAALSLNHS